MWFIVKISFVKKKNCPDNLNYCTTELCFNSYNKRIRSSISTTQAANTLNLVYLEHKTDIFLFLIASFITMLVFTYVTSNMEKFLDVYIPLIYRDGQQNYCQFT